MNEWREVKLGEFVFFQRGHDLPKSQMKNGEIPVAGSNGIIGYHDTATMEKGITIGRSGNIGTPKFYPNKFWAHNTVLYVKNFFSNDERFAYYFLRTIDFSGFNTGSAVPTLNRNHIHELLIKIPPLPEQQAIASVLSSLDDKIDLLHRQNKTLEEMAQTLFRQWFVENVGEDWEISDLSQIISLQNGYAFKSKDFISSGNNAVIKIKNISNSVINIKQTDFISDEIANKTATQFKLKSGDILIAMTGAEIGKLGIMPKTKNNFFLNQRVAKLNPKFFGAEVLAYLHLRSDIGQDYIKNTATGSAQPNISGIGIQKCPFPKLTNDELLKYGFEIKPYYEKIIQNLGQIQTLEHLRDTLLPKLMSGEVRVKF